MLHDETQRLKALHVSLDAAVAQLERALEAAAQGTTPGQPSEDMQAVERALAEVAKLRNGVRDRLMARLSRPRLDIVE